MPKLPPCFCKEITGKILLLRRTNSRKKEMRNFTTVELYCGTFNKYIYDCGWNWPTYQKTFRAHIVIWLHSATWEPHPDPVTRSDIITPPSQSHQNLFTYLKYSVINTPRQSFCIDLMHWQKFLCRFLWCNIYCQLLVSCYCHCVYLSLLVLCCCRIAIIFAQKHL